MDWLFARHVLLADGWRQDVRLGLDGGRIARVETNATLQPGDERHGALLPGLCNLHSHAFQRGMAGLTEHRGTEADSFWTWREIMYRFALSMTPEQMEAIAAQLYVEMLEAGFTRVGEFHYLHHDRDGRSYSNVAEMAARICAATDATGIGLTLLPVFYAHGGFGGAAPHAGQRRFIGGLDDFQRLLVACQGLAKASQDMIVGVAPHSLRAVTPDELKTVAALAPNAPLHMHIAEQTKEVDDCLAWSGARPVQWLLDNVAVDQRWCLIHATYMTADETQRLARSGAVAGLCTVTEANLGDGIFNGHAFLADNGRFGVGSDSNILIGIPDELRQFEYSQRLRDRTRNVLAGGAGSTGQRLFDGALSGGAQALGIDDPALRIGARADLISLDLNRPHFAGRTSDQIVDSWIFSARDAIDCVWVGGKKRVAGGRHLTRDAIAQRFAKVQTELMASA